MKYKVNGSFDCRYNKLKDLKGIAKYIGFHLDSRHNSLESIEELKNVTFGIVNNEDEYHVILSKIYNSFIKIIEEQFGDNIIIDNTYPELTYLTLTKYVKNINKDK